VIVSDAGRDAGGRRPGQGDGERLRGTRAEGRRLVEIEEGLLAPLDVVEDHDERRLLLKQLPKRPGDLVAARPDTRLTEQRTDGGCCRGIRGQHGELLDHLDDRPVGDPFAVGQAATSDDASLDRCKRLRHEPRLAHPRVAHDRHELAASLRLHFLPAKHDLGQLALASDEP